MTGKSIDESGKREVENKHDKETCLNSYRAKNIVHRESNAKLELVLMTELDLLVDPEHVPNQYVHTLTPLPDTHTSSITDLIYDSTLQGRTLSVQESIGGKLKKASSLEDIILWGLRADDKHEIAIDRKVTNDQIGMKRENEKKTAQEQRFVSYIPPEEHPILRAVSTEKLDLVLMTELDLLVGPGQVSNQYIHTLTPLPDTNISSIIEMVRPMEQQHTVDKSNSSEDEVPKNLKRASSQENLLIWGLMIASPSQDPTGSGTSTNRYSLKKDPARSHLNRAVPFSNATSMQSVASTYGLGSSEKKLLTSVETRMISEFQPATMRQTSFCGRDSSYKTNVAAKPKLDFKDEIIEEEKMTLRYEKEDLLDTSRRPTWKDGERQSIAEAIAEGTATLYKAVVDIQARLTKLELPKHGSSPDRVEPITSPPPQVARRCNESTQYQQQSAPYISAESLESTHRYSRPTSYNAERQRYESPSNVSPSREEYLPPESRDFRVAFQGVESGPGFGGMPAVGTQDDTDRDVLNRVHGKCKKCGSVAVRLTVRRRDANNAGVAQQYPTCTCDAAQYPY